MNRHLIPLAAVLVCAIGSPATIRAQAPEPPFDGIRIEQRLDELVPLDLRFRDEMGEEVVLRDYFGERPVVLVLAYYRCPMLCTLVLNGLSAALQALTLRPGSDFEIVTVSIDPRETPDIARAKKAIYLEDAGLQDAAGAWHFLTGDEASIVELARAVGFHYQYDAETDQYAHAAGIMVLTPGAKLARYFYGIEYAPRDIRFALVEASEGRVGTLVDHLLLLCYQYDPATGRYGAVTVSLVRLGAVLTLAALATFVLLMLRRDARLGRHARDGVA
ncbi:MAG TPA: SCO family protein [Candidatus Polarisedimenticolia bacterium]|nr:SCO family protein [Candidatus Polarisedimenticolia bacterium]